MENRLSDEVYTHPDGTKAQIHYVWGASEKAPAKIKVTIALATGPQTLFDESDYLDLEGAQARARGMAKIAIEKHIEHGLIPTKPSEPTE